MKNNFKLFIGIIIGALLSGVTVYAASTYLSKDVTFTPTNSEWNVSNVEEALNDLYSNSNGISDLTPYKSLTSDYGCNKCTINASITDVEKGTYIMEIYRTTYDAIKAGKTGELDYSLEGGIFNKISNTMYEVEITETTTINITSSTPYTADHVGGYLYVNLYKIN